MSRRRELIGFFLLLLVVDWFLFFRHAGHFFQADTIFLLAYRDTSIRQFLGEFVKLHQSGWYRPLANEVFESILYPIFGLDHPVAYRIPVYLAFAGVTIGVYILAKALSGRKLLAALAALFFNIHTVNAYVTFDLGFMPELLYALFYIAAVIAYLRYVRERDNTAYRLSIACFVGSLLSKEAAVTLPGVLMIVHLAMDSRTPVFRKRLVDAIRSILPHATIMFVYVAMIIGYLGVGGFSLRTLFDRPANAQGDQYHFVLDNGIWKNLRLTYAWAFNLPEGYWGIWRPMRPAMIVGLKAFRIALLLLAGISLFMARNRRMVLFGTAWFAITIIPALPLLDHFIPYYLFLPVVGLSLVVGAAFTMVFDALRRPRFAGVLVILAVFGGLVYLTDRSIRGDIRDNRLLGGSAKIAVNSLSDLKAQYPTLPPNVRIYFEDAAESVSWEHSSGKLIKMAYNTDQVSPLYASLGDSLPSDRARENAIVFNVRGGGHLVDRTSEYRRQPELFIHYKDSETYALEVSANQVKAGRDRYKITIRGAHDVPVRITYTIDDGPILSFIVGVDDQGSATFNVGADTKKGEYKFLGFNIPGDENWIRAEKTIRVE